MSDVNILAQHINALTTRTMKLTQAMAKHDSHESSFMSAVNKRITNLVNEMKSTHSEINLLQNMVYNNTQQLEHLFFKMSDAIVSMIP